MTIKHCAGKAVANALALALACAALLASAAASATPLKGYDATGKAPGNVLFYDAGLDLTWTVQGEPTSYASWTDAQAWADGLTLGGTSAWRLPTMVDAGAAGCDDLSNAGSSCGFNVDRSGSELAYLFHETLGNASAADANGDFADPFPSFNAGPFSPALVQDFYWFGSQVSRDESWTFDFLLGYQSTRQNSDGAFAIAVFDGDVGAVSTVPEPGSGLLALISLAALLPSLRRRKT